MKNNSKYSLVTLLLFLIATLTVNATNFTVNSLADTNTGAGTSGTLRWCMNQANLAGAGPHTIAFDVATTGGTITLTGHLPVVSVPNVTIDGIGDGSGNVTIDANGGDITRYIFRANATGDFAVYKNFILQNTGYELFRFDGSPTDITIENIVALHTGGNFFNYGINYVGNALNLTVLNFTMTQKQNAFQAAIYISGTATNVLIDNFDLSDSGGGSIRAIRINGAANNVTIQNCDIDLDLTANTNDGDYGILFSNTASNIVLNNNTLTNIDLFALYFGGTTTNIDIDGFSFINGDGGATTFGMRFVGVADDITMANVTLDLDHSGTTDDGDYGIYFNTTTSNVSLDNITMHDTERNGIYIAGVTNTFSLTNSTFDNFDGWTGNEMIRFNGGATGITMTNVTINSDLNGTTDDGNYGIFFNSDATSNITLTNVNIDEADEDGIHFFEVDDLTITGGSFNHSNEGIEFYNNDDRSNNVITGATFDGNKRTGILINVANATTEFNINNNIFSNTTGDGRGIRLFSTGGVKNIQITNNTFFNNSGPGIYNEQADGVLYSQNSFYNNPLGIDNVANNGNNDLERLDGDTPRLLSSIDVGGGNYDVTFNLPAFCTDCDIEFFTNQESDVNYNGRTYTQVALGLSGIGPHTVTVNAGGATDGFWTTTLKDNNQNSSVSEFSGAIAINPKGPANVDAGIALWARADISGQPDGNFTVNNGWKDYSGNTNHYEQLITSDPNLTSNRINFNKAVVFDGNDYASLNNANLNAFPSGNGDRTVFVVSKITATSSETVYSFGNGTTNQNQSWRYENGTIRYIGWSNDFTGTSAFTVNKTFIGRYDHDGTTASINSDGRQVSTSAKTYNTNLFAGNTHIGVRAGAGAEAFRGDIAEVIVYNRKLTALENDRVESYLALKYGITLDQTAPKDYIASDGVTKIWDATVNVAYTNDVTGIGRDDDGFFSQKQSKSINTDAIVSVGLGEIAIDNPANANTFAADKNFLVWGNDDASTALQTTEMPATASATHRIGREWKVAETGSVSNLTMAFSGASASIDLELYIDTDGDGDFTNATVITGGTITNGIATFAGVDLNDGDLFTLGYTQVAPGGVLVGLDYWLDPSTNVITSGTSVIQWSDKDLSGNNLVLAQGNPALYPTFNAGTAESNFNPYVDFTTNTRLHQTVTGSNYAKSHSIFAAYRNNQAAPGSVYATFLRFSSASNSDGGSLNWGFGYNTYSGANYLMIHYITAPFAAGTITLPLDQYNQYNVSKPWATGTTGIVSATIDQAGSQAIIGFDGDESINDLGINNNKLTPRNFLTLGGGNTYGQRGWGQEIIEYSVVLSQADREKVDTYLAIKYGTTLTHNYLASDNTVFWTLGGDYDNDIAGIARDDNGVLNQKQSRSVNSDAIVTIGLGVIATTNATNANTFTADKDFLVWGNDDASTTLQTTELPATATAVYRLGREWKVAETGAVSNLTITFNTPISPSAYDIELFVDTDGDGDFTNATVITGGTVTNGVATFTGVDLNNGDVFTLGMSNPSPGGVSADLDLWLKADAGTNSTTNGTDVNTWLDQSTITHIAAAGGNTHRPTFIDTGLNFNPALNFPNTGTHDIGFNLGADYIFSPAAKGGMHIFTAGNPIAGGVYNFIYDFGLNSGGNVGVSSSMNTQGLNGGGNDFNVSTTISSSSIVETDIDFGLNNTLLVNNKVLNATAATWTEITATQIAENPTSIGSAGPVSIGRQSKLDNLSTSGGRRFRGDMGEVIVYTGNPLGVDAQKIRSYLAIKYGVTLDQVTPTSYLSSDATVIWDAVANPTFSNDIAGIGQDDISALNQKQSKSVNAGTIVTIGLGTIDATNIANLNTFAADKDFLVWGNDNVSTAVVNSGIPSSFSEKINRNWLVNETGAVGNTLVQIPNSAVVGFSNTTALMFFVADDAGFTTNLVAIPLVQNGANWEVLYDFNGAKYFTFGIVASGDFMRHGKYFQGGIEQLMKF